MSPPPCKNPNSCKNRDMTNGGDIKLGIKQARKVYVLESLAAGKMTNSEAASALGLSVRQIQRIGKEFRLRGDAALIHGNKGRKPAHTFNQDIRDLVAEKTVICHGTSCQHISEIINKTENISISAKTVTRILKERNIENPCSHKAPKVHLRREHRAKIGELVQIDSSPFDWLSNGQMLSLLTL